MIADLVREHIEDTPGEVQREAAREYEARLQFARFQVRARELQGASWDAYLLTASKVELLDGLPHMATCGARKRIQRGAPR